MRLYLGGKMRGIPLLNFPAFMRAARLLREVGHTVVNPAEHDLETGHEPLAQNPSPAHLAQMLRWDFREILDCDGMVVLPGWEDSRGTAQELVVARGAGVRVYEFDESLPTILLRPLDLAEPLITWRLA